MDALSTFIIISTHTPTRGVTITRKLSSSKMRNFNSHAHEGRDLVFFRFLLVRFNFNSHAHEGRDVTQYLYEGTKVNFNSHAHEGRDNTANGKLTYYRISTHTPTRGVTLNSFFRHVIVIISTHTPTRGVTYHT